LDNEATTGITNCDDSVVGTGLVLAAGSMLSGGVNADTEITIKKIVWPTACLFHNFGISGFNRFFFWCVVIKTDLDFTSNLLGQDLPTILNQSDLLDARVWSWNPAGQTGAGGQGIHPNYMWPDYERRWEVNVQRRLQSTETIVALVGGYNVDGAVPNGTAVSCTFSTMLSVLVQRSLRRR